MASDVMEKYKYLDGGIVLDGSCRFQSNSGAVSIVLNGDKAYVTYTYLGKIVIIIHKMMRKLEEIDF